MDVICITVDLTKLPLMIRNEVVNTIQKSKKRFLLEDQKIQIDINTMLLITPILQKIK